MIVVIVSLDLVRSIFHSFVEWTNDLFVKAPVSFQLTDVGSHLCDRCLDYPPYKSCCSNVQSLQLSRGNVIKYNLDSTLQFLNGECSHHPSLSGLKDQNDGAPIECYLELIIKFVLNTNKGTVTKGLKIAGQLIRMMASRCSTGAAHLKLSHGSGDTTMNM